MTRLEMHDRMTALILSALEYCRAPIPLQAKQFTDVHSGPNRFGRPHDDESNVGRYFASTVCWLASTGYLAYTQQAGEDFTGVRLTDNGREALYTIRRRLRRVPA
ncbi:hypothetical protein [Burkholderia sp. Nafp2/4-1b]|uniref:hypothetical protein n=1 Tax=Burkholderia sp. Nafp2/4-1b TaxID=2116686 RepID=UPI0013CEDA6D|nr:hypothetical protein [Burkholderia sp. Nafp2/4-1b]